MNPPFTLSHLLPPLSCPVSSSFLIAPDLMLAVNANPAANPIISYVTVQSSDHSTISQAHEDIAESLTLASSNSEPQSSNPVLELVSFPATALNVTSWCNAMNYMNMATQHLQMATTGTSLLDGWNPRLAWLYPGMQEPQQKRKSGKIRFMNEQTNVLEQTFNKNKNLSTHERKKLAQALALTEKQVNTWFQNRRAKWRRIRKEDGEEGDVPASV